MNPENLIRSNVCLLESRDVAQPGSASRHSREGRRTENMFFVYILFSKSLQKYYVGSTSDLQKRIVRHNTGGTNFTSKGKPWTFISSFECKTRVDAVRLELKIKKRGISRYLSDNNLL